MRVLIAEDERTSRHMLAALLARAGYETVLASDGNEAWQHLSGADAPGVAVLDWMMPGITGIELCLRISREARETRPYVILLTSRAGKRDIVAGLQAGANDYIIKPFDREELLARVQVGRRVIELETALARHVAQLQEAMRKIHTLHGLIPICSSCKSIRDDRGYWKQVEEYVGDRSEAEFSHSLCPDCLTRLYPDLSLSEDDAEAPP
jgi:phosphoserine phosphatase RsbU/P